MAGQRKLMSEIDRTLKKVTEGVEVFNDIWDKVYAASAQNQKEKHEADLKKEIKKLQRFRDQIKNWIGNSDVKDKRPLIDARKLIEQKMEEFKVCEKETKTKAYSKEGLAQVERLDPAEQARQATRSWIQECLSQFNEQIEAFECDLERMQQAKGRNKNKAEKENLEALITRHKWHILKLEQINRLLDNDALEPSDVDELKDDIDYYLEANQEPGFLDTYDDDLYEVLDLDTLGSSMQVGLPTEQDLGLEDAPAVPAPSETVAPVSTTSSTSSRSKTPKKSVTPTVISGIGRPGVVKPVELKSAVSSTPVRTSSAKNVLSVVTPNAKSDDSVADDKSKARTTPHRGKTDPVVAASPNTSTGKSGSASSVSSSTASSPAVSEQQVGRKASPNHQRPIAALVTQTPTRQTPPPVPQAAAPAPSPQPTLSSIIGGSNSQSPVSVVDEPPPLTEEQRQILRMIDESFMFMPEMRDSEKANRYAPRNPYAGPLSFPATPSTVFDNANIFAKLDVDTLFFIFYYQQGSYQQYLAARELKRRTWGYHKKYKTWFKRHEEPQVTGDDYEQGTFVYFDYETGWCQRIKTEFTFEYSYLEDELQ
ncbi:hypothetical protein Poli38472_013905 [Pythium oligandrum]|uniref:CCR4-NOT transcription complex subunit 3 n=1 Tax=Pythium oligandrum TaxID=41045 RepID=A0A8K1C2B3_PYTOL|nr:hypothetical protein Poli38472_013905 [Pythium oligandrum]|eukprot:TMW55143.1 hypothetical protein Poli38472_013905 [Pythium oligandrum]